LAENRRHPQNVYICHQCGELTETSERQNPGTCQSCKAQLTCQGPAKHNCCVCPSCGVMNTYPTLASGPPRHRLFAIEYHCPMCRSHHKGRFFKKPEQSDLAWIFHKV
jgi:hypothetical protein